MTAISNFRCLLWLISFFILGNLASGFPGFNSGDPLARTDWIGSTGNWFDSSQWSNGIPTDLLHAGINQGRVQLLADASLCSLTVGYRQGTPIIPSELFSSSKLTVTGSLSVGRSGGVGTGTVSNGWGKVDFTNGNLEILTIFDPSIQLSNGGTLSVGDASGTGINTKFEGIGEFSMTNGTIDAIGISVGSAGGTGSSDTLGNGLLTAVNSQINLASTTDSSGFLLVGTNAGTGSAKSLANGQVTLTDSTLTIMNQPPSASGPQSVGRLTIGSFDGSSNFTGNSTGVVTLDRSPLTVDTIIVGMTSPIAQSSGKSNGSLFVNDADVTMRAFRMSSSRNNGGPAKGLFQQIGGTTTGESFFQGDEGTIVLGIGGPLLGEDYSQIRVDTATLEGMVEARFVDGYQPQRGDVFDLFLADSISGNYSFSITGIDLSTYPELMVERSSNRIRLTMPVPEPNSFLFAIIAAMNLALRRPNRYSQRSL